MVMDLNRVQGNWKQVEGSAFNSLSQIKFTLVHQMLSRAL
jgi:hypothetical protein